MFDQILQSSASKICVKAAPGSGKTKRILIPKVCQILADETIDPKNVLLLTFSRLSAKDLKERVQSMKRSPRTTTVHSLCLSFLLSENGHGMRNRVESILLDFEKDILICDLKMLFTSIKKPKIKKMLEAFSAGWATKPHDQVFEEDDQKRRFKAAIVNWLSEHEAAMMEEIVYGAVELARQLGSTEFIREPQHIFVDEYQDLNRLEQEFINLLAAESQLMLVVGDPDQSIYSFKYSYPNGINDLATTSGVETYISNKTGRCPRKIVEIANQLLKQSDPARTQLLESIREDDGETHFVRRQTQEEEFKFVLRSVASRLAAGTLPNQILILVPRKRLGFEFAEYANAQRESAGLSDGIKFKFVSKMKFSEIEKERLLLLSLLIKPDSLLHIRSFLGLGDDYAYAREIRILKEKYGSLKNAIRNANSADFSSRQTRMHTLCQRINQLKAFLAVERNINDVNAVLDELFPADFEATQVLRSMLSQLQESDDSLATLHSKFIDYLRTIPTSPTDVRVMTLMGSKGLEAEHVYILGCNGGNIPGENRSSHMTEHEHKEEQRRLLFVGITRASKTLTISWARQIPYGQSMQHHTQGLRPTRQRGQAAQMVLGMSEFLSDLRGIVWEQ